MSKESTLRDMSQRAEDLMHLDNDQGVLSREETVEHWQRLNDLAPDGWPGGATLSALWRTQRPDAGVIVHAALDALRWSPVAYSQTQNVGMGESWLPDNGPFDAGDCSDFECHCLGVPKKQLGKYGVLVPGWPTDPQWLGAAAFVDGAIGTPRPWHTAMPGDLIAFGGREAHVEVVVDVSTNYFKPIRIITVGCSSSSFRASKKRTGVGNAIAKRDRTALWARQNAVVVTPWWNAR